MSHPAIELKHISQTFKRDEQSVVALDNVSLSILEKEFIVLLGASGCGKTTLLKIMAGIIEPSAGEVTIHNQALWLNQQRNNQALDQLGVVFQDANLFPWLSIEENVALPLKLRGVAKAERLDRARELCQLVGITGFEKRWPNELSGGMRQRASIARALSCNPNILLMDEPFGALDAMTRDQMNLEVQRIWLETQCTVVLVTHAITEAVFLADRVFLLSPRPGKIDTVIDVGLERPRDLYVQSTPDFQSAVLNLRQRLDHIAPV